MDRLRGMSREKMLGWSRTEFGDIIAKLQAIEPRNLEQDALLFFLTDAYRERWPGSEAHGK